MHVNGMLVCAILPLNFELPVHGNEPFLVPRFCVARCGVRSFTRLASRLSLKMSSSLEHRKAACIFDSTKIMKLSPNAWQSRLEIAPISLFVCAHGWYSSRRCGYLRGKAQSNVPANWAAMWHSCDRMLDR